MSAVEWPARLQRLTEGTLVAEAPPGAEVWLDGGHNPGAGEVIAEALAGHEDLDRRLEPAKDDPKVMLPRRQDPGPLFPWTEVLLGSRLERLNPLRTAEAKD